MENEKQLFDPNMKIIDKYFNKRLIDANEVERKLRLCISSWYRDCNSNAPVIARTFEDALQRVIYAPTVDAVEVVHGRWDHHASMARTPFAMNYDCSVCGNESAETTNYCPNCGAKMDGERKDNA